MADAFMAPTWDIGFEKKKLIQSASEIEVDILFSKGATNSH